MRRLMASCRRAASGLSIAAALSLPTLAHAGTAVWTTGGPYGGRVYALAVDPSNSATLYAGTGGGGVFKSTDAGATWVSASTGLAESFINALAIDPTTPSTVYAGTASSGTFKSTDAGATWAAVNNGLASPYGRYIRALAIDPSNPATLYAGTAAGVFKSTTSGSTWGAASVGLTTLDVAALAIDPLSPSTLYAGTNGGGLFKSVNAAGSWTAANTGLTSVQVTAAPVPPPPVVTAIAVDPQTPATVYAGLAYGGLFKSTNGGGSWTAASAGLTDLHVSALTIDPVTPATLYAGTWYGVFKSTNSGSTWTAINTGLTWPGASALAVDSSAPAVVYAGTGDGVFKSVDSGGSWAAATDGMMIVDVRALAVDPVSPSTLYAGTEGRGVFRSTDSGHTWVAVNTGLNVRYVRALAIDPKTPTTLYAGTNGGGVYKSTDAGGYWAVLAPGLNPPSIHNVSSLAIDPLTPSTLYAGTYAAGILKSTNSGVIWSEINAGLSDLHVSALAVDPLNPATLYAGTAWTGGVFKSTNGGATWIDTGLTTPGLLALAIDPETPSTLYAGTDGLGLWKSTNSGGTWGGAGGVMPQVSALAIEPKTPSTLYAGTPYVGYSGAHDGGVFRSTDKGETWTSVNKGLMNVPVQALAIDGSGATTLYAGLAGGVWQATPPVGADADLALGLSDSPDPVTGTTPLRYTLVVSNAGPGTAGAVSVVHTLPAGVVFESVTGSGWTCVDASGVVTCTRPGLAVGTAPDITVEVRPGPLSTVLNSSASVSAPEGDPDASDNSDTETTTVTAPLVWMGARAKTVLADSGEFVVNANVTYTIALTNAGPSTQTDNAGHELVDVLPSSLVLVSAGATSGTANADLVANTVSWDGSLPSGGSVTVTIHATIGPRVALGTRIANQATVSYDADGNGTNEATIPTDDPSVGGDSDPTSFVVVSPTMDFYTLPPCRLIDTRNAAGTFGGPALVAGTDRVFPLFDRCLIPSTARALSVNLTVTQPTVAGNLRLYPAGTPLPLVSSVNYSAGQTRANNAIVPLNGLGELAVRCAQASGTAHVILDVNGYFEEAIR